MSTSSKNSPSEKGHHDTEDPVAPPPWDRATVMGLIHFFTPVLLSTLLALFIFSGMAQSLGERLG